MARSLLASLLLLAALACGGAHGWSFNPSIVNSGRARPQVALWGQAAHDDPLLLQVWLSSTPDGDAVSKHPVLDCRFYVADKGVQCVAVQEITVPSNRGVVLLLSVPLHMGRGGVVESFQLSITNPAGALSGMLGSIGYTSSRPHDLTINRYNAGGGTDATAGVWLVAFASGFANRAYLYYTGTSLCLSGVADGLALPDHSMGTGVARASDPAEHVPNRIALQLSSSISSQAELDSLVLCDTLTTSCTVTTSASGASCSGGSGSTNLKDMIVERRFSQSGNFMPRAHAFDATGAGTPNAIRLPLPITTAIGSAIRSGWSTQSLTSYVAGPTVGLDADSPITSTSANLVEYTASPVDQGATPMPWAPVGEHALVNSAPGSVSSFHAPLRSLVPPRLNRVICTAYSGDTHCVAYFTAEMIGTTIQLNGQSWTRELDGGLHELIPKGGGYAYHRSYADAYVEETFCDIDAVLLYGRVDGYQLPMRRCLAAAEDEVVSEFMFLEDRSDETRPWRIPRVIAPVTPTDGMDQGRFHLACGFTPTMYGATVLVPVEASNTAYHDSRMMPASQYNSLGKRMHVLGRYEEYFYGAMARRCRLWWRADDLQDVWGSSSSTNQISKAANSGIVLEVMGDQNINLGAGWSITSSFGWYMIPVDLPPSLLDGRELMVRFKSAPNYDGKVLDTIGIDGRTYSTDTRSPFEVGVAWANLTDQRSHGAPSAIAPQWEYPVNAAMKESPSGSSTVDTYVTWTNNAMPMPSWLRSCTNWALYAVDSEDTPVLRSAATAATATLVPGSFNTWHCALNRDSTSGLYRPRKFAFLATTDTSIDLTNDRVFQSPGYEFAYAVMGGGGCSAESWARRGYGLYTDTIELWCQTGIDDAATAPDMVGLYFVGDDQERFRVASYDTGTQAGDHIASLLLEPVNAQARYYTGRLRLETGTTLPVEPIVSGLHIFPSYDDARGNWGDLGAPELWDEQGRPPIRDRVPPRVAAMGVVPETLQARYLISEPFIDRQASVYTYSSALNLVENDALRQRQRELDFTTAASLTRSAVESGDFYARLATHASPYAVCFAESEVCGFLSLQSHFFHSQLAPSTAVTVPEALNDLAEMLPASVVAGTPHEIVDRATSRLGVHQDWDYTGKPADFTFAGLQPERLDLRSGYLYLHWGATDVIQHLVDNHAYGVQADSTFAVTPGLPLFYPAGAPVTGGQPPVLSYLGTDYTTHDARPFDPDLAIDASSQVGAITLSDPRGLALMPNGVAGSPMADLQCSLISPGDLSLDPADRLLTDADAGNTRTLYKEYTWFLDRGATPQDLAGTWELSCDSTNDLDGLVTATGHGMTFPFRKYFTVTSSAGGVAVTEAELITCTHTSSQVLLKLSGAVNGGLETASWEVRLGADVMPATRVTSLNGDTWRLIQFDTAEHGSPITASAGLTLAYLSSASVSAPLRAGTLASGTPFASFTYATITDKCVPLLTQVTASHAGLFDAWWSEPLVGTVQRMQLAYGDFSDLGNAISVPFVPYNTAGDVDYDASDRHVRTHHAGEADTPVFFADPATEVWLGSLGTSPPEDAAGNRPVTQTRGATFAADQDVPYFDSATSKITATLVVLCGLPTMRTTVATDLFAHATIDHRPTVFSLGANTNPVGDPHNNCLSTLWSSTTGQPDLRSLYPVLHFTGTLQLTDHTGVPYPAQQVVLQREYDATLVRCWLPIPATGSNATLHCEFSEPLHYDGISRTVTWDTAAPAGIPLLDGGTHQATITNDEEGLLLIDLGASLSLGMSYTGFQPRIIATSPAIQRRSANLGSGANTFATLDTYARAVDLYTPAAATPAADTTAPVLRPGPYRLAQTHGGRILYLDLELDDDPDDLIIDTGPVVLNFVELTGPSRTIEALDVEKRTGTSTGSGTTIRITFPESLTLDFLTTVTSPPLDDPANPGLFFDGPGTVLGNPWIADSSGNIMAAQRVTVLPDTRFNFYHESVTRVGSSLISFVARTPLCTAYTAGVESQTILFTFSRGITATFVRPTSNTVCSAVLDLTSSRPIEEADAGRLDLLSVNSTVPVTSIYFADPVAFPGEEIALTVLAAAGTTAAPTLVSAELIDTDTLRVRLGHVSGVPLVNKQHVENYQLDGATPIGVDQSTAPSATVDEVLLHYAADRTRTHGTQFCLVDPGDPGWALTHEDSTTKGIGCVALTDSVGPRLSEAVLDVQSQTGGKGLLTVTMSEAIATTAGKMAGLIQVSGLTGGPYASTGTAAGCALNGAVRTCVFEFAHVFTQTEADSGTLQADLHPMRLADFVDLSTSANPADTTAGPLVRIAGSTGGAVPSARLVAATWDTPGTVLDLTWSDDLDETVTPATSDFSVAAGAFAVDSVLTQDKRHHRLQLTPPADLLTITDTAARLPVIYQGSSLLIALTITQVPHSTALAAPPYAPRPRYASISSGGKLRVRFSEHIVLATTLTANAFVAPAGLTLATTLSMAASGDLHEVEVDVTTGLPTDGATHNFTLNVKGANFQRVDDAATTAPISTDLFIDYRAESVVVPPAAVSLVSAQTIVSATNPTAIGGVSVECSSAMTTAGTPADWVVYDQTVQTAALDTGDNTRVILTFQDPVVPQSTGRTPSVRFLSTSGDDRPLALNGASLPDSPSAVTAADRVAAYVRAVPAHEGSPIVILLASEGLVTWDAAASPVTLLTTGTRPPASILSFSTDSRVAGYATVQMSRAITAADQGQLVFSVPNAAPLRDRGDQGVHAGIASMTLQPDWVAQGVLQAAGATGCTTRDLDGNGRLDAVDVTFSAPVTLNIAETADWHVGDHAEASSVTQESPTVLRVHLAEADFDEYTSGDGVAPGESVYSGNTHYRPNLAFSGVSQVVDAQGVAVSSFAISQCADGAPPVLTHARISPTLSPNELQLFFSERLVATGNPRLSVRLNSAANSVASTGWPADTWTRDTALSRFELQTSSALSASTSYTVSIDVSGTDTSLTDAGANSVANVLNFAVDRVAQGEIDFSCTASTATTATLTFTQPVSVSSFTAPALWRVFRTHSTAPTTVAYSGDRLSATLTFSDPTQDTGHPPWISALTPDAVVDEADNKLTRAPVSVVCPDHMPPELKALGSHYEFGQTSIYVAFTERMDAASISTNAPSAFVVVDHEGNSVPVTYASVDANLRVVRLLAGQALAVPSLEVRLASGAMTDAFGNAAAVGQNITLTQTADAASRPRVVSCEASSPDGNGYITRYTCPTSAPLSGTTMPAAWSIGDTEATSVVVTSSPAQVELAFPARWKSAELQTLSYDFEHDVVLGGGELDGHGVTMSDDTVPTALVLDRAEPAMMQLTSYESNTTVINVVMSERVTMVTTNAPETIWSLEGAPAGVTVVGYDSTPTSTDTIKLQLSHAIDATTLAGTLRVHMGARDQLQDLASNNMVSSAQQAASPYLVDLSDGPDPTDGLGPAALSAECVDVDLNGRLDQCTVTLEKEATGATQAAAWTVNGVQATTAIFNAPSSQVRLLLPASMPRGTGPPMVAYDADVDLGVNTAMRDPSTNFRVRDQALVPSQTRDTAQPVLLYVEAKAGWSNVTAIFSEPMVVEFSTQGDTTLSVVASGLSEALAITGFASVDTSAQSSIQYSLSRPISVTDFTDGNLVFSTTPVTGMHDTASLMPPLAPAVEATHYDDVGEVYVVCAPDQTTNVVVPGATIHCGQNITTVVHNNTVTTVCLSGQLNETHVYGNLTVHVSCPATTVAVDPPGKTDTQTATAGAVGGALAAAGPYMASGLTSHATGGPVGYGGPKSGAVIREMLWIVLTAAGAMIVTWSAAQSVAYQAAEISWISETALYAWNWASGAVGLLGAAMMHYAAGVGSRAFSLLAIPVYVIGTGAFAASASLGRETLNVLLVCLGSAGFMGITLMDYMWAPRMGDGATTVKKLVRAGFVAAWVVGIVRSD